MATRPTINFPLKSFKELNKILRLYFTEYVIDNKMIFGDSLLTGVRRIAVITDDNMTLNGVCIQPNATQQIMTSYRVSKDQFEETDEAYRFFILNEPDKKSDEKFKPYFDEEPNLSIYKWHNESSISDVYKTNPDVERAWQSISNLKFEDIDPDIYEEFNMDRVGVVNTSCDKDPLSIIITRQLFPSYEKSRIRVAGIEFHKDEQIRHAIFESIFCNVTIYTLVAVM